MYFALLRSFSCASLLVFLFVFVSCVALLFSLQLGMENEDCIDALVRLLVLSLVLFLTSLCVSFVRFLPPVRLFVVFSCFHLFRLLYGALSFRLSSMEVGARVNASKGTDRDGGLLLFFGAKETIVMQT